LTFFDRQLDTSGLIGAVIDAEVRMDPGLIRILAKDPDTQRMERADVCAGGSTKSECPLAHLLSGLVGEGYRADIIWPNARIDEGCDSICDDAGFAAARAGKNKQRPFSMKDRFSL
jgi:hypothetical protein